MTYYAVVLTFPADINQELDRLRDRYNKYVGYSIVPHLTLKSPFIIRADLTVLNERLTTVASRTKPFVLELDGVNYFEESNNVAYIAIRNKRPVIDLHVDIVGSLEGLVDAEYEERYDWERFIPHITIAECIPEEVFPVIKKELSGYTLNRETRINSFTLFFQEDDAVWKPDTKFRLSE